MKVLVNEVHLLVQVTQVQVHGKYCTNVQVQVAHVEEGQVEVQEAGPQEKLAHVLVTEHVGMCR